MADLKFKKIKNSHAGHRVRMMNKYRRLGADAFEEHELLEMLLYFSIPRHNTNEVSHSLIENSDSLFDLMTTPSENMESVKGFGERSADLLKLSRDTMRCAELRKAAEVHLNNSFRQTRYVHWWFRGKKPGTVMAVFLDKNRRVIDTETLASGRKFRPESYPPVVLQYAQEKKADAVIIAHSHTDNCPMPSVEDLHLTSCIRSSLGAVGITLVEHYIVTEHDCIATSTIN